MTKATTAEGEELRHSLSWVMARRAILKVTPSALICGDWEIPYDQIDEAVLFSIWDTFPGFVLRVRANGMIYQFGVNWNPFWKKELPFPVSREKGELGYSAFSISIRLAVFGYAIYWIWKHISN
jgi:hypothetical protein